MRAALVLMLLGAAARSAEPIPEGSSTAQLKVLQERTQFRMERLIGPVKRLEELREGYENLSRFKSLETQRAALRAEIAGIYQEFFPDYEDFRRIKNERRSLKIYATFGQLMGGRKVKSLPSEYLYETELDAFANEATKLKIRAEGALILDEKAYQEALRRREARRVWLVLTGLGVLAAVAVLWVAFLGGRRAPAPTQVLAAAPSEIGPGSILGNNYRIEKELGRGGMGFVYE
ncbi:MAG: hypothetical protein AAB576_00450, partial [Elusimicrobiota bacterium]